MTSKDGIYYGLLAFIIAALVIIFVVMKTKSSGEPFKKKTKQPLVLTTKREKMHHEPGMMQKKLSILKQQQNNEQMKIEQEQRKFQQMMMEQQEQRKFEQMMMDQAAMVQKEQMHRVSLPDCPCDSSGKCPPGCNCSKCSRVINEDYEHKNFHNTDEGKGYIFTQMHMPYSHSIHTDTRAHSDYLRGDLNISSPTLFPGQITSQQGSRDVFKGGSEHVFGA
jgi:hypothetical protein